MPIHTVWESRGVVKTYEGFITGEELVASVVVVQGDPRFDQLTYSINDFLGVSGFDLGDVRTEDIAMYPIGASSFHKNACIAYIATDPRIVQALQQLAAVMDGAYPNRIFATLAEARAWIQAQRAVSGNTLWSAKRD